jgi:hypothetical protein
MEGASHHIWNNPFTDTTLHRILSKSSTPEMIAYESLPLLTSHPLSFFMLGKKSSCLFPSWNLVLLTVYVTAKISSSQIFHPLTEELSAMCDLVLLATYVISW